VSLYFLKSKMVVYYYDTPLHAVQQYVYGSEKFRRPW